MNRTYKTKRRGRDWGRGYTKSEQLCCGKSLESCTAARTIMHVKHQHFSMVIHVFQLMKPKWDLLRSVRCIRVFYAFKFLITCYYYTSYWLCRGHTLVTLNILAKDNTPRGELQFLSIFMKNDQFNLIAMCAPLVITDTLLRGVKYIRKE